MRIRLWYFLGLMVAITSGCSSMASRSLVGQWRAQPSPCYFGGVRPDGEMFSKGIKSDDHYEQVFEPIYATLDMPWSLGSDILFVPYDVYADIKSSQPH
jgi:uncharacterized protein YceK